MKFIISKQTKKPAPFMPAEIWNNIYEIKEDMEKAEEKHHYNKVMNQINSITQDIKDGTKPQYKRWSYEENCFMPNPIDFDNDTDFDIEFMFKQTVYRDRYSIDESPEAFSGKHRLNAYEWSHWETRCVQNDGHNYLYAKDYDTLFTVN